MVNPLDKKLSSILKSLAKSKDLTSRAKAEKDYVHVRSRIGDDWLRSVIAELVRTFGEPASGRPTPSPEHGRGIITDLRNREFTSTSSFLFQSWIELTSRVPALEMLRLAPDAAAVEVWRKKMQIKIAALEDEFLASAEAAYESPAGDWLLTKAKPERLVQLFNLLLSRRPRPKFLPQWQEALSSSLLKDKRGGLLECLLRKEWSDDQIRSLSELICRERGVFATVVEILPRAIAHEEAKQGVTQLLKEFWAATLSASGARREELTAGLARVGTGILLSGKRSGQTEAALIVIQEAARQLRGATAESEARFTWVFTSLAMPESPSNGRLHITREGAQHFAVAFEKSSQGFIARDVLTLTALSVGLQPIGKAGEALSFNPLQHFDTIGGTTPGEQVTVTEPGWLWKSEVVVRAKVKPA